MFVTLFNLQGAHRSSAAGFYPTTLFSSCQVLFLSFFQNFFRARLSLASCVPLLQRFYILPHLPALVKNFFRLFSKFFVLGSGLAVSDAPLSQTDRKSVV